MQKIINDPSRVVDEMVEGYLAAYAETVEATSNPRVLKSKLAPIPNKVGIVTGGGSGTSRLLRATSDAISWMPLPWGKSFLPRPLKCFSMPSEWPTPEKGSPAYTVIMPGIL